MSTSENAIDTDGQSSSLAVSPGGRSCGGQLLRFALIGAVLLVVGQQILFLLSRLHPIFELASHFCLHALAAAVILLPFSHLLRCKGCRLILLVTAVHLCWQTQPWTLLPAARSPTDSFPGSIRVMSWNLLVENRQLAAVHEVIEQHDPDLLLLIEVRPGLVHELPFLAAKYPYRLVLEDRRGGGIAVFSRVEGTQLRFEEFGFSRQPAIIAQLDRRDGQSPMQLIAMHAFSPVPLPRTPLRDLQLHRVAKWSEAEPGPFCLVGDLNITPWTSPFRSLLRTGFQDSRVGAGNMASWPSLLGDLGIPIDHALVKGPCAIGSRSVLPVRAGSDHRPIVFDLHY